MARDNKGFVCHQHRDMVSYEMHHVWPKSYHGPDTKANLIKVCPNAHSDIHYLMERLLKGKPFNYRHFGHRVRFYAWEGYRQVTAYADTLAAQM